MYRKDWMTLIDTGTGGIVSSQTLTPEEVRLIEAAPDLLEALKSADIILDVVSKNPDYFINPEIIDMVKSAIAKAEST